MNFHDRAVLIFLQKGNTVSFRALAFAMIKVQGVPDVARVVPRLEKQGLLAFVGDGVRITQAGLDALKAYDERFTK